MQSHVLFMSLVMANNDVEYGLLKLNRELGKIDNKINHLQTDIDRLLLEIEKYLAPANLSEAI